jgi:protein-disulfide isomerase
LSQARRQRLWQFGAAATFVVILAVVAIVVSQSGSSSLEHLGEDRAAVAQLFDGIPQHGQTLGDQKAPATLLEFADLQCPFCRSFTLDVLPTLIDRYVRPGDLRLRFEVQTFIGPQSEDAARVALAASLQNRLWDFADVFYRNQDDENSGYVTEDFLSKVAGATPGLDAAKALRDRDSQRVASLLTGSAGQFRDLGFNATPSFAIETPGKPPTPFTVTDPGDSDQFTSQLDSLLK